MSAAQEPELLPGLEELAKHAGKLAAGTPRDTGAMKVVAFFDLSGSTSAKLSYGNTSALNEALAFTGLASAIAQQCDGQVLKTLGDGALAVFSNAVSACRASLNLRYATYEYLGLRMTAGLTAGAPATIELEGGGADVLGDAVDRAARIQSLAAPGQVLMDDVLFQLIRGEIGSRPEWDIDPTPRHAFAKGIGDIRLHELAMRGGWKLKKQLATPFQVIANGRPSLAEKLALLDNAQDEIIEIGIGLTSFARYFTGQKPEEFRDPIRRLVRRGVDVKCFALDPGHKAGVAWLAEQGDPDYQASAAAARKILEAEGRFYRNNDYRGTLSYYAYRRVPEFWCLGVDVEDDLNGRMFFASYLMGIPRPENPVFQLSRTSQPALYQTFLRAVREVREASEEPLRH